MLGLIVKREKCALMQRAENRPGLPHRLDKLHDDETDKKEEIEAQEPERDFCHGCHFDTRHTAPHVFSCSGCIRSL